MRYDFFFFAFCACFVFKNEKSENYLPDFKVGGPSIVVVVAADAVGVVVVVVVMVCYGLWGYWR